MTKTPEQRVLEERERLMDETQNAMLEVLPLAEVQPTGTFVAAAVGCAVGRLITSIAEMKIQLEDLEQTNAVGKVST